MKREEDSIYQSILKIRSSKNKAQPPVSLNAGNLFQQGTA